MRATSRARRAGLSSHPALMSSSTRTESAERPHPPHVAACARSISHHKKFVDWSRICWRCCAYGTWQVAFHDSRNASRCWALARLIVSTAHWYETSGSVVQWKSMADASPGEMVPTTSCAPESDTAARTFADGSSEDEYPTLSAVIAPADEPPIAIRSGSMLYAAALVRRKRTAVCASAAASWIAGMQFDNVPEQPGDSSR